IGGRVGVASRPGGGTTVRLAMPFSVMMTRVLTVEAGGQVFGIPFDAVVETVQRRRDDIGAIGAAHAFTLREHTLPLIALARLLGRQTE
ncbi:chemotaxis protein CheW, partial [Acinetobacter baumannii]